MHTGVEQQNMRETAKEEEGGIGVGRWGPRLSTSWPPLITLDSLHLRSTVRDRDVRVSVPSSGVGEVGDTCSIMSSTDNHILVPKKKEERIIFWASKMWENKRILVIWVCLTVSTALFSL